jgi:hypothetical protein
MAKDPMDDKYVQQFKKHLEQVDAFTLVVLKSHLIMESAIDNVIRLIFFHPDIILDARMNFFQKVEIVRAYALREDEMSIWKLMHAIAARNEVAHNLEPKKREPRMEKVRRLFYSEVSAEIAEAHKNAPDEMIVMIAASLCTGFLGSHENDLTRLRKIIDEIIADTNFPRNPDGSIKKKPVKGYE